MAAECPGLDFMTHLGVQTLQRTPDNGGDPAGLQVVVQFRNLLLRAIICLEAETMNAS